MIKTIPAIIMVVCDLCKKESKEEDRRLSGSMTFTKKEFCYMGDSQGIYTKGYDLCDTCVGDVITFIEGRK